MSSSSSPGRAHDLERLVTTPMPFGQYAGRLIADLPGHYLAWFARQPARGGEIDRLLRLMYEIDHNDLRAWLEPLRAASTRDRRGGVV